MLVIKINVESNNKGYSVYNDKPVYNNVIEATIENRKFKIAYRSDALVDNNEPFISVMCLETKQSIYGDVIVYRKNGLSKKDITLIKRNIKTYELDGFKVPVLVVNNYVQEEKEELVYNSVLGGWVHPEDSRDYYSDDELSDIEVYPNANAK